MTLPSSRQGQKENAGGASIKQLDNILLERRDVKSELLHVRELVGVPVRKERGAPKPRQKLRPEDWTGWSENRTRPMTLSTKPTFRGPHEPFEGSECARRQGLRECPDKRSRLHPP